MDDRSTNRNLVDQYFHLPGNARKDFCALPQQHPTDKLLLPWNLLHQWIRLIPCRNETYSIVFKIINLTSLSNSSGNRKS